MQIGIYVHYAWVLVDLDVARDLPATITIERGSYGFIVRITYENFQTLCKRCGCIGQDISLCKKKPNVTSSSL